MSCSINGNTVRKGITNFLDKELNSSNIFDKEGEIYVAKPSQYFAAQYFVRSINGKFSENVIKQLSDKKFSISIPENVLMDYIVSTKEGQETKTFVGLYTDFAISPQSWNEGETFMALNYPEISEFTYNQLVGFLKSLNPEFRVEEIDNLSQDGVTNVKDFLIKVKTLAKFQAMPEEVAHVFIELLADTNPLKVDMLANITSYPVYSQTLARYKDEYTKPDGTPDYNKIKREAATKLVAEYVTAISTGDKTRVDALGKPRQSWLQRWFSKFMEWLGIGMRDHTRSYADVAGIILSGTTDETLKTAKEVEDINYSDSFFYRLSEQQAYENAVAIIEAKPPKLLETISNFSREFGRRFNDILKDEHYSELNEMLKKSGQEITKINRLSEIKVLLGEAGIDMRAAADSNAYVTGLKQFLEAVDRLDILSDGILAVIKNKAKAETLDEAIKNIKELEGYFGIYETFNNIISADLATELIKSGVGDDVVLSIQRTQNNFKVVNDYILDRLRNDLFIFYKVMLATANDTASKILLEDIERAKGLGSDGAAKLFQNRMDKLVISDDDIIKMLSGKGRDIDNFSSMNHLINAAYVNGDLFLSSIARYVQQKVEAAQVKGSVEIRNLYQRIDPIQKLLNEDAVTTGKKITFTDNIYDRDTGETRKVLTWLNPHKDIQPILDGHRRKVQEAAIARYNTDKNSPEFAIADAAFKDAQNTYNEFLEKYYNRPFLKEYYDFRKKYQDDTDFISAMAEWQRLSEYIRDDESLLQYEPENTDLWESLARTRRERSNLLNEYDEKGDTKSEAELKEVRILKQFFDEQSKFKEDDEVQTERSYQIARNRYEQKVDFAISKALEESQTDIQEVENSIQETLKDNRIRIVTIYDETIEKGKPIDSTFLKQIIMDKWYKKNVTIQRNDAFYEFEEKLRKELDELQKKGELTEAELNIKEAYDSIRNILFGSRDQIGHIDPSSLSEEEKLDIQTLEDYIAEQRLDRPGIGISIEDFSAEDRQRYDDLNDVIKNPDTNNNRKRAAIRERNNIIKKYKNVGKNKAMRDLINLLGSLTEKSPTNYYWDKMITFIPHVAEFGRYVASLNLTKEETQEITDFVNDFITTVDTEDWDRLDFFVYEQELWGTFIDWLKDNKVAQYNWFIDNHTEKTVFDHENGAYVKIKWGRGAVYNYTAPVLEEHSKITYNRRFRKQRVKDEYRTGYNPTTKKVELQTGVHVTNREYNGFSEFLPLLPEQGEPVDSPYHNQAYYDLRDNDAPRFQYLTELRNAHLEQQEKLPSRLRTWNQVPVMRLSHIEDFNPEHIKDQAREKWNFVKSIFQKQNEAAEASEAAQGNETSREIDQFTQTTITQRIPKLGMSQKLAIGNVSRNLLKSTAQFILRAYEFEARSQTEPVVKSLIRVMKDNEFKNQMSNKERAKKFESVYSQMILQEVPETTLNNKNVRRIAKTLTGNTALRMLADPIGGIINYASAMVNDTIEAASGKYLNINDLAKGKVLAFQINTGLMADYNKKANLSYETLLFDTFDFIQGDFEEDLLDRSSSKDKHASIRQMMMIPRKSGELMAQTAIAMGMLERTKVQNSIDGKMCPIHKIYKKNENNLALKEGFPLEWNPVDGVKFLRMRDLIHRVNFELHGNYAKVSQSEASRYAIGKLAENMKRWFMPAFQRRFGRETLDLVFEDLNEGYYRTSARAARNIFGSMFRLDFGGAKSWLNVFIKTPRYRQNLQRMGAEMAQALLLFITFSLLLGYSGDDKNKKLESNNWIHNTAILIALRVYSETTAYIPFPPFGFQEMKRNVLTPFSLPADAVSNFAAIAQLGLYQVLYWFGADGLHDSLYYSKDAGYWYSDKGDSKLMKYVLNSFGHTGYHINPDQYIQQFDNIQKRLK